ncbi:hypothetical protein N7452_005241 [Penicillium brevicompactum]|uniref:SAC3/GANP/Nin1/mts3/eIF-3 p25 n=1 Tax=Penicillium brevicompactum TaxID=5074 RepID=A0A9W9QP11_PENBR|nr:hypothetical protein N7452_005241 [Penicillium brevicompactum]
MSRLRPVADSLQLYGFVSKGDKKLLDHKIQAEYFDNIAGRYMRFCDDHSKDLDAAHASLPTSSSNDATSNPPATQSTLKSNPAQRQRGTPPPAAELSTLLLSLRKLREAVLATAATVPTGFSQRVHVFSIRLSILAHHPPSYFPSLRYVLNKLHSPSHPLAEAKELITYLILDYACRQEDLAAAFELRARARKEHAYQSHTVDKVLTALIHNNWVIFWQIHNSVDSHVRAVMNWAVDRMRRHALKAVGSAYLNAHINWILHGCTGDDQGWTWEELVEKEKLRWEREGDKIIIKRPRQRPAPKEERNPPAA